MNCFTGAKVTHPKINMDVKEPTKSEMMHNCKVYKDDR